MKNASFWLGARKLASQGFSQKNDKKQRRGKKKEAIILSLSLDDVGLRHTSSKDT